MLWLGNLIPQCGCELLNKAKSESSCAGKDTIHSSCLVGCLLGWLPRTGIATFAPCSLCMSVGNSVSTLIPWRNFQILAMLMGQRDKRRANGLCCVPQASRLDCDSCWLCNGLCLRLFVLENSNRFIAPRRLAIKTSPVTWQPTVRNQMNLSSYSSYTPARHLSLSFLVLCYT